MKKIFSFALITGIILLLSLTPVSANIAGVKSSTDFALRADETSDKNLYGAGATAVIEGEVKGDLITAGGTVLVSGKIQKDVMMAGGTVNLSGDVGEDVRAAGGNIVISGRVNGDLIAVGGTINITSTADIKGEAFLAGGQIAIEGKINGKTTLTGGDIKINGLINGDITVEADNINIGDRTVLNGNLTYTSPKEAIISGAAKITGGIVYEKSKTVIPSLGKKSFISAMGTILSVLWLTKLFTTLAAALVIYFLFRKSLEKTVKHALLHFWNKIAIGFIALIVTPAAILVLLITIVGAPLSALTALFYAGAFIISGVFAPIFLGSWLFKFFANTTDVRLDWLTITVGATAYQLLKLIPIAGWIISFALFLAAFGTIWRWLYERLQRAN